ncbi:hypothetical protein P280DRAFT_468726 [Massarina eburnea CBS 473.64]|uniref:Uncharacterized protein n=1 Tax=Massarina eburnea CBS 473.64 TaxID=1395130 RepID=A0A6A6S0G2_9PLEO|nr:hypothetical protein P280DRAFT_468726 [Massarina eburnea CBS 473.64]
MHEAHIKKLRDRRYIEQEKAIPAAKQPHCSPKRRQHRDQTLSPAQSIHPTHRQPSKKTTGDDLPETRTSPIRIRVQKKCKKMVASL